MPTSQAVLAHSDCAPHRGYTLERRRTSRQVLRPCIAVAAQQSVAPHTVLTELVSNGICDLGLTPGMLNQLDGVRGKSTQLHSPGLHPHIC